MHDATAQPTQPPTPEDKCVENKIAYIHMR